MEDFSTVIWVIIILGAMFFNGVMQAKKQAKKHPQQPGKHTGEAWPSWDTQSEAEMQRRSPEDTEMQAEMQKARAKTQAEASKRRLETQTYEVRMEPSAEFRRSASDFEEIAAEPSEFDEPAVAISGYERPATKQQPSKQPIEARTAKPEQQATPDAIAEITEDFDLRKAVIYSELLKPKFSEE